jgi:biotin synthase
VKNKASKKTLADLLDLYEKPFMDLIFLAQQVHRENFPANEVQVSTLLSIKTGGCPENCKYCPQSAHYDTGLEKEALMQIDDILKAANEAKKAGASRFCMGAAWRNLHDKDAAQICEIVKAVKETGLQTCMTLGMITADQAKQLKDSGLDYYNHNIDTSEEFYEKIITTRKYQDRLDTLENVADADINVCSGGIVGMGETREDRAKMILTLCKLNTPPKSVPINMLEKVKGTPLEGEKDFDVFEFIRTIAVARIALPESVVRLSAGRQHLSQEAQSLAFLAGANSIFYGEKLLTQDNPEAQTDKKLFEALKIRAA